NDLLVAANEAQTATAANGAGYTALVITSPQGQILEDQLSTASGSYNATAPLSSSGPWIMQMVAFRLAGSGSPSATISASPASNSFGNVQVGNTGTQFDTLNNAGNTSVTISQATVTGSGFSVSGLNLPLVLTPGLNFTFSVAFTPAAAGEATGNLLLTSNASNPSLNIALSGTALAPGQLAVSPSALDFGSAVVGTSKNMTAVLSASGSSVQVSAINVTTSEFRVSGLGLPFTVDAGQSVPFTVIFTPQSSGQTSDTITFVSGSGILTQPLTGNGTS